MRLSVRAGLPILTHSGIWMREVDVTETVLLYPKKRWPRPADWGIGMTVGIAAIANDNDEKTIIFATDQMMSVGIRTADLPMVTKGFLVHDRWFALYAGTVTLVPPIVQKVRTALSAAATADIAEVSSTFVRVYQEERARIAEQAVLSPFGLDMPTFISLLATNQSAELADMKRRIQDFDFDCEFLVGGFDASRRPHIFTVTPPGIENHYDSIEFWSIGSGSEAALSNLLFRRINSRTPLKQAIYHVAEAKFMSEFSMGVGKNTLFLTLTPNGECKMLSNTEVPKLRQIWETEGQPPIPANLDTRVPDFWSSEDIDRRISQLKSKLAEDEASASQEPTE